MTSLSNSLGGPGRQTGVMDSFDVFGNAVLLTSKENSEHVAADVDLERGFAGGACRLPNEAGLI